MPRPLGILGRSLVVTTLLLCSWGTPASGQAPGQPAQAPASFKVLADQVAGLFPALQTEVVEVSGRRVTLASGRAQGVQPGLELTAFREGRELYHPTTKKLLGRTEETLGRLVVTEAFETYSVATLAGEGAGKLQPGDRARVSAGKVRLTVVALTSGARSRLVEAATYELVQELERTGRFQVGFGDQVAVWLGQEKIAPEEFMRGKGVRAAAERFGLPHLLVVLFTTAQGKPFMDVRLFSAAVDAPLLQNALFVPPSIRQQPTQQFSSGPGGQVRVERRSLLERLLSGDFEPNRYSASAASIPIRAIATFPFPVTSMDVAVAPGDRVPRVVLTDGQRVFLYRLNNQVLEPEWTHDKLMAGRILSVQFAELTGDDTLEVVVNRQDVKVGMLSYILTTSAGRPALLAEDIPVLLLAMDEKGEGVPRSLWGQRYDPEKIWAKGGFSRYVLKDHDVAAAGRVLVNDDLRVPSARFSNITGKEQRAVAFVDEQNRLKITTADGQELWRSLTVVGGGLAMAQTRVPMLQTLVDKFFKVEPAPVSVDLDGDGVEEIVVPINQDESGRMAVVFRGPAGYRMQVVSSGFEGLVTGLGAIPGEGGPSLVAAVLRRTGIWRNQGDTQIIMTVPE
jgi:hypothetical protein